MKQKKPRIVLDTNIIISSFFGGNPLVVLNLFRNDVSILILSTAIFDEFKRILLLKIGHCVEVENILYLIQTKAEKVSPKIHFDAIPDDPSDNKFLEAAIASKADFIISGDKHLLNLKSFQNIPILTPKQFLDQFHA